MDRIKFAQFVRQFPFLNKVVAGLPSFTGNVNDVLVKKGDRNLLEVTPSWWNFDAGSFADCGYRRFWVVSPGEFTLLKEASSRSDALLRKSHESAETIGVQLDKLNTDVQYVVEASDQGGDGEDPNPTITIYKMKDFAWWCIVRAPGMLPNLDLDAPEPCIHCQKQVKAGDISCPHCGGHLRSEVSESEIRLQREWNKLQELRSKQGSSAR